MRTCCETDTDREHEILGMRFRRDQKRHKHSPVVRAFEGRKSIDIWNICEDRKRAPEHRFSFSIFQDRHRQRTWYFLQRVLRKRRKDRNIDVFTSIFKLGNPEIFETCVRTKKERTWQEARVIYRGQDRDPRTENMWKKWVNFWRGQKREKHAVWYFAFLKVENPEIFEIYIRMEKRALEHFGFWHLIWDQPTENIQRHGDFLKRPERQTWWLPFECQKGAEKTEPYDLDPDFWK